MFYSVNKLRTKVEKFIKEKAYNWLRKTSIIIFFVEKLNSLWIIVIAFLSGFRRQRMKYMR